MQTYKDMYLLSKEYGERMDCAVRAVAVATGVHYIDVQALMTSYGRTPGRRTPRAATNNTLAHLGFDKKFVPFRGKTVCTLEREFKRRKGTFLVSTRGHILAIKDGVVQDWAKGRKHRVLSVCEVIQR